MYRSLLSIALLSLMIGLSIAVPSHAARRWIALTANAAAGDEPEVRVIEDSPDTTVIEIAIAGFYLEHTEIQGAKYCRVAIPGSGMMADPGRPDLPAIIRYLALPQESELTTTVQADSEQVFETPPVLPFPRPLPDRPIVKATQFEIDRGLYAGATIFPADRLRNATPEMIREVRCLRLTAFPFRYDFATQKLVVADRLRVTIEHRNGDLRRQRFSRSFLPLYQAALINFSSFRANCLQRGARDLEQSTYLVICHDDFAAAMQPLLDWKTRKGVRAGMQLMSAIGSTDADVYNFIHDCYTNWETPPTYVLLVGDTQFVPCHYGVIDPSTGEPVATDHYYACMDGDELADLYVSRFSVQTLGEAATMTAKAVSYERYPSLESQDWYAEAMMFYGTERPEWFNTAQFIAGLLQDEGIATTVMREGQYGTPAVANAINAGLGFSAYRGHGELTEWVNVPFSNSDVLGLLNGGKTPIVISPTCETGQYDEPGCLAECFTTAGTATQPYGAVACWASSRDSYTGYNDELACGFFKSLFWDGLHSFAAATNGGKLYMTEIYGDQAYYEIEMEEFNNFGDPELQCWGGVPREMTVRHPATIPVGAAELAVTVVDPDGPVADALVCVMKGEEIYQTAYTDQDGAATLPVTSLTTGAIAVTVTAWLHKPYEGSCLALVTGCGYLALDKRTYNCSDNVRLTVWDSDLNLDPNAPDTWFAQIRSTSEPNYETVAVTETGNDTGEFRGMITLSPTQSGPGYLLVHHGDAIDAYYHDAICDGQPHDVYYHASCDCNGPVISNLAFSELTERSVVISWRTDEPSIGRLYYGETSPPSSVIVLNRFQTQHEISLDGLSQCTAYFYYVVATDVAGNETIADNNGQYYHFTTLGRFILLNEPMDSNPHWSISGGEWAWGQPTGAGGGYCGFPDPTAGCTNLYVYGYNLDGNYAANLPAYYLTTPPIDCQGAVGVRLQFYRYLNVETSLYDHAAVSISNDGVHWTDIYRNDDTTADAAWQPEEYDVAAVADGARTFYVRWTMGPTDSSVECSGWNIDDVSVSYLQPCEGPNLFHTNHAIDDSVGNDDGIANPGELIAMPITLGNNGAEAATGVSAIAAVDSPYVTLINYAVSFPDIPPGFAGQSLPPQLAWVSAPQTPDGETVHFTLDWQSNEGSGATGFAVVMSAPVLTFSSRTIDDGSGDHDGIADPGELVRLPVTLANQGSYQATNVTGTLASDSPYITLATDTATWPTISPGALAVSNPPNFELVVDDDAPVGELVTFTLEIQADFFSGRAEFKIVIGQLPVLVIDDGSGANAGVFSRALSDFGFLVDEATPATTDPAVWNQYAFLVSSSGANATPIVLPTYRSALETFVSNSGKLIIEGGEVGYRAASYPVYPSFAANVLHISSWVNDFPGNLVADQTSHPLCTTPNQLPANIHHQGGAGYPYKDGVVQLPNAARVFRWSNGSYAAVIAFDEDSDPLDGGQIIYLPFNVEGLDDGGVWQSRFLENCFNWLVPPANPPITPTPTVVATATPTSTETPPKSPTTTPVGTATPASPATPTPPQDHIGLTLTTNEQTYRENDQFVLTLVTNNPGSAKTIDQYIVLDVFGVYWFWDNWDQGIVDFVRLEIPAGEQQQTILEFTWPAGAGAADGIVFWAVLCEPLTFTPASTVGNCSFGWE